jgi:peptide/nickel transport system substrate-binding protein
MAGLRRRHGIGLAGAGAASGALPCFKIDQADNRPTISVAMRKISITNVLDTLREQSNVSARMRSCSSKT